MISPVYRHIIIVSILIIIVTSVPDVIFGLLIDFGHLLVESGHTLFEVIEISLDHLVEHLFETDLHQTQVIVFYIIVFVALSGCYWLWHAVPRLFRYLKESLLAAWEREKIAISLEWQELPLINKIKLIAICATAITCYILFGF